MCVCIRCCLATLVVAALVSVPQTKAFPLEGSSTNLSQRKTPPTLETKSIADKQSELEHLAHTSDPGQPHNYEEQIGHTEVSIVPDSSLPRANEHVALPLPEQRKEDIPSSKLDQRNSESLLASSKIKEAVPQTVVYVTEMIKPVADVSSAKPATAAASRTSKTGDPVPQINASVSKMFKPAAVSSPATGSVPNSGGTAPEPNHEKQSSTKDSKDTVLQINVSKTKTTEAAAVPSPATGAAPNTGVTIAEVSPDKQRTENKSKVYGPVTPSDSTEEPVHQSPPSPAQVLPATDKNQATERSSTEPPGGQYLTTVITPLHPAAASSGGPGTSIATDTTVPEITGTKPSMNSFTITSKEFAKKTADALTQVPDETSTASVSEHGIATIPSLEEVKTTLPKLEQGDNVKSVQKPNEIVSDSKDSSDKTTSSSNANDSNHEQPQNTSETVSESPLNSPDNQGNMDVISVTQLADKITNKFKKITDDVTKVWNERRDRASWLKDAADVLRTYNNKITETKHFIRCNNNDIAKYKERKKSLKSIKDSCEKSLKRNGYHQLENSINEKLKGIVKVIEDYHADISQITKDQYYNSKQLEVEESARRKLQDFDAKSLEKSLLDLKDKSLQVDEEEYTKCLTKVETKKEGDAIISETLTAIMKIYNCV